MEWRESPMQYEKHVNGKDKWSVLGNNPFQFKSMQKDIRASNYGLRRWTLPLNQWNFNSIKP